MMRSGGDPTGLTGINAPASGVGDGKGCATSVPEPAMLSPPQVKPNLQEHPPPGAVGDFDDIEAVLGLRDGDGRRARRWMWLAAGMAVAGAAVYFWIFGDTRSETRYVTEPAVRAGLTVLVTATGSVQPLNKVDVSSELSGTVRKVHVDYNSSVSQGQVLAELDTEKLVAAAANSRAKLDAARSQVALAEATLAETDREHERKRLLAGRGITTVHELEAAQAAHRRAVATLEHAKAQVAVAEADLNLNEINLSKAVIHSPIQGIVLTRNVDPGQTVAVALQAPVLFTIAEDLRQMELQVDVDEADVGKIGVGQDATFGVDAYPERRFPAQIRDIRFGSEIIQGVVTYKAVLTIDNSDLALRPGMTATADIVARRIDEALLVPNTALRFSPAASQPPQSTSLLRRILPGPPRFRPPSKPEDGGTDRVVWILRDAQPTAVSVGVGVTDGRRTEIVRGELTPGDPVIVDVTSGR